MSFISERMQKVKPSATLTIIAKAKELAAQGRDIINLSGGEPDFDPPPHILEAANKAMADGHHRYTAVDGTAPLKRAIINKFAIENKLTYQENQVIASTGAKQSIYNALMATLNEGDEVIVPAPYWVSYPDMIHLAGGKPVFIACTDENDFKPTPEQLKNAITKRTKWLILNSPNNPSGAVLSLAELKALGDVLREHPQVLILSDDVYEPIVYNEHRFLNIVNACPDLQERTLVLNALSKTYAMTGWRLGYAGGPVELIKAMNTLQSQSTSNPCSITQEAGIAALSGPQDFMEEWLQEYNTRRLFLVERLNSMPGVHCNMPQGAFYAFPSCQHDDVEFATMLLEKAGVAVVPGSVFGAPGHFRLSFANSMDMLVKACDRIEGALQA